MPVIFLHRIKGLFFVIEAPCVLGEVGTVFDNRQFSKLVIRRSLAAETRVLSHTPICVRFLVKKMVMREVSGVFCFFSTGSIIPPLLHNHLHFNTPLITSDRKTRKKT
jgi:hypothetical protein